MDQTIVARAMYDRNEVQCFPVGHKTAHNSRALALAKPPVTCSTNALKKVSNSDMFADVSIFVLHSHTVDYKQSSNKDRAATR